MEELGALVECRITRHQHYGLVVRTLEGDRLGYVDQSAISDEPYPPSGEWPAVGTQLSCVMLGGTRDGRLRLSSRPRDVELVRSVIDVVGAVAEWRLARDDEHADISGFLTSSDAFPVLRWALRHAEGSKDRARATDIVSNAPEALRERFR